MPLYEYLCDNCNTKFEVRRAMKESDAPMACPECQSERVDRQLSIVFAITRESSGGSVSSDGCSCNGGCGCGTRAG